MLPMLPSSRGGGMCREESAEAIVTLTTKGEGLNFVLRTEAFAVRVTVDTDGCAGMRGALAEVTEYFQHPIFPVSKNFFLQHISVRIPDDPGHGFRSIPDGIPIDPGCDSD